MSGSSSVDSHTYTPVPVAGLVDESFTLSYSIMGDTWVAAHDYIPDFSVALGNRRLLQFYQAEMYEMNVGMKGNYFGFRHNTYITPVFNIPMIQEARARLPFILNSISFNVDIENMDIRLLEETMTQISMHNSYQGTMEKVLIPLRDSCSLKEQYGKFNIRRIKNRWVYNYAINEKDSSEQRTWKEELLKFTTINTELKACTQESLYKTPLIDDYVIIKLTMQNQEGWDMFFYELNLDVDLVRQ